MKEQNPREPAGKGVEVSPAPLKTVSAWTWAFRMVRWTTYAGAVITLVMVFHKTPAPVIETSPAAAARMEQKFEQAAQSVSHGEPATMRMDETELNSYLVSHLDLAEKTPANANGSAPPSGSAPRPEDIEHMRSNVKDVKVQLIDNRVRAYVVFDVHGKDMTLVLEGKLGAENGYLRFEPTSGQIGSMPLPQSALASAVERMMDSPENREKLKLPADVAGLKIENGEVVTSYK
jgi:hypothetical protein